MRINGMGLLMSRKYFQDEVKYTDHGTYKEHCSICQHFQAPSACDTVQGAVVEGGWCNKFSKETSNG